MEMEIYINVQNLMNESNTASNFAYLFFVTLNKYYISTYRQIRGSFKNRSLIKQESTGLLCRRFNMYRHASTYQLVKQLGQSTQLAPYP